MKRNNTKRAFALSLISILLCFTMLIGSTFAWFTDTASTAVSTIQSGILDVGLEHKVNDEWENAEGKTLNFVRHNCTNGRMLWEPGCTYDLEPVKVVNNGNLALKYKIEISGALGEAKLLEVIDWTVKMGDEEIEFNNFVGELYPADTNPMPEGGSSESGEITISGHMREEAGNEYQNLTLEGIGICVYATQYAWECDSYGNTYDENAGATECTVTDIYELRRALESPYNENIVIENDLFNNPNEDIYHPVVQEGTHADQATVFAKIPENTAKTIDFNGHTLKFKTNNVEEANSYAIIDNYGSLTLTNTVEGPGGIELTHERENMYWDAESTIIWVHNGTVTVKDNVTLEHKGGTDMAYAIDLVANNPVTVNIEGGTVKSVYRAIRQFANNQPNTVNISGGEVIGGNGGTAVWIQHFVNTATLNITGGTLKTMDGRGRIIYVFGAKSFGNNSNGRTAWKANENNKVVVNIDSSAQIPANNTDNENDYGNIVVYKGQQYLEQEAPLYDGKIQINREGVTLVNEGGGSTYVECYFHWIVAEGGYYEYSAREPEVPETSEP